MHRRCAFALGFAAPIFALVACVNSSNSPVAPSDDAGKPCPGLGATVILCGSGDDAGPRPEDSGAPNGRDATVADSGAVNQDSGQTTGNDAAAADSGLTDAPLGAPDTGSEDAGPRDANAPPPATGTLLWAAPVMTYGATIGQFAIDDQGDTYFMGSSGEGVESFDDGGLIGNAAFVGKMNASGVVESVVNCASAGSPYGYAIGRDAVTGELYGALGFTSTIVVAGTSYTPLGAADSLDLLVVKLDAGGNVTLAKQFGGPAFTQGWSIAAGGGRVVVTGYTNGPIDFGAGPVSTGAGESAFLLGLDTSLNYVYGREYGSIQDASMSTTQGYSVVVDSSGNSYACGAYGGEVDFGALTPSTSPGMLDGYIVSLDPKGGFRWVQTFDAAATGGCGGVTIDADQNIDAVGVFTGSANFGNGTVNALGASTGFVASWTSSGAYRWATPISCDTQFEPSAIATDRWDEIAIAGAFSGDVTFGGSSYTANSEENGFLAKFDPVGNVLWSQQWKGGIDINPMATAFEPNGDVLVSGTYFGGDMIINSTTTLMGDAKENYAFVLATSP